MKKNMGKTDQMVRILAALIIGGLYLSGQISGTTAVILGIIAVVFLLTSMIGFCPLYVLPGISTRSKKKQ